MIKKCRFLILLVLLSGLCFAKSGLHFTEEDLSFCIEESVFSVRGVYYFSSEKGAKFPIFYPFPTDSAMGDPYDIHIRNLEDEKEILF